MFKKEKTAGPEKQLIVHLKIFGQSTDRFSVLPSPLGKADFRLKTE